MMSRMLPSLALFSVLLVNGIASAAVSDHQQCFKIKDPATKALYTADLVPADSAFATTSGCTIKVPAKYLCIDVEKTNVSPAPPGADDGQPAQKSLCYKVKCPKGTQTVDVEDQFGSRTVTVVGTSLVCAPIPVPVTTTSTTTSTTTTLAPGTCNTAGDCPTVNNGSPACAMSLCYIGSCAMGYSDCDGQYATGCEADFTSDPNNCGGCNSVCMLPNATNTCVGSSCQIGSCDVGYADCDNLASSGCEVDTRTDLSNCGGCNLACNLDHATATCTSSNCLISSCSAGYLDCDGNTGTGCEVNSQNDPANCGSCGNQCFNPTPNCISGMCMP